MKQDSKKQIVVISRTTHDLSEASYQHNQARSTRSYTFLVHCTCALFMIFSMAACHIPSGRDAENANAIGQFIAKKYGRFEDISKVEKSYQGKAFYYHASSYPILYFYEITDLNEIAAIEEYARESLKVIEVDKIKLMFYEKQNMRCAQDNTCSRHEEKLIKEIEVIR